MLPSKDTILKALSDKPTSFLPLARKLRIPPSDNLVFSACLTEMERDGQLLSTKNGAYFLPKFFSYGTGVFRSNKKGFGFINPKEPSGSTVYVSPQTRFGAINFDEVEYALFVHPDQPQKHVGWITKVTKHTIQKFVALVVYEKATHYRKAFKRLEPLGDSLKVPVRCTNAKNAKQNHFMLAKVDKVQNHTVYARVTRDLGPNSNPMARVNAFVTQAGVPTVFSSEALKAAALMPKVVGGKDVAKRVDLRDKLIVTIDGKKSQDFDDAVNVEMCPNGNYKLGVHIADVSHYVQQDSVLDKEAFNRGTSVYLPGLVIPMLPESLSNGICSLNPNVDRLTISCIAEITPKGETVKSWVASSVIRSKHRLTYAGVNNFLQKKPTLFPTALKRQLKLLQKLAKILKSDKAKAGYIGFNLAEPVVSLKDSGQVKNLETRAPGVAEGIIEQLMVRANEVIAEKITEKHLPFLYRVHEKPPKEKLDRLQEILRFFQITVPTQHLNTTRGFARFVNRLKRERFDHFVQVTLLRTLSKAVYSANNVGHFGLGSRAYTHFTSPIRRYPDLVVHRMVRAYVLENKQKSQEKFATLLPVLSKQTSATEVRAQDLERQVLELKEAEYYKRFIGKVRKGTITAVKRFGFFVELADRVSGLVHKFTLTDNTYTLSKDELQLVSNSRRYKLGDQVEVVIVGVVPHQAQINMVLRRNYQFYLNHKKQITNKLRAAQGPQGKKNRNSFTHKHSSKKKAVPNARNFKK